MRSLKTALRKQRSGFTLVEGLVVVVVLAILFTAVIVVIKPGTKIKESRDSRRKGDLTALYAAISLYATDAQTLNLGASSTVYISIPDPMATSTAGTQCQGVGDLPSLAAGWTYHCSSVSTLYSVDGTGWLPVDLTKVIGGSPVEKVPVDPANSVSFNTYFAYALNGDLGWSLSAFMESAKGRIEASAAKDAGYDPERFEIGSDLTALRDAQGLTGYWTFDETSGTSASDSSGNGYTGTLNGAPVWESGKIANALSFDGVQDSVSIPVYSVAEGETVTISYWANQNAIASHGVGVMIGSSFAVGADGGANNRAWVLKNGVGNYYGSKGKIPNGRWVHLAAVVSPAQTTYYVDGTVDITAAEGHAGGGIIIGKRDSNTQYWKGMLDDVRIYRRALSATEIKSMYEAYR